MLSHIYTVTGSSCIEVKHTTSEGADRPSVCVARDARVHTVRLTQRDHALHTQQHEC